MVGLRQACCLLACVAGFALGLRACCAGAQETIPPGRTGDQAQPSPAEMVPRPPPSELLPGLPDPANQPQVVDVRVQGHKVLPLQRIHRYIRTRGGRPLDPEVVEDDVRGLLKSRLFLTVDTSYESTAGGVIVIFHVTERPMLRYVRYVGNDKVRTKTLARETGLKKGDALDPYAIEEARRKLEELYISKGFSRATVKIIEGTETTDRGAVFLINEGQKQKIFRVEFVGNTIVGDGRLQTQIESKRPLLFLFKGQVDRQKIDDDVERLTSYYRSLGFFKARVGRELDFNEKQNWLTLTFVIDEGPRYVVRNVSFIGHSKFSSDELADGLKLKSDQFFDQMAMTKDVSLLLDKYGSRGYVYADVQPDPRFLPEPGQLDLVYQIEEGDRYRVGRIDVLIEGENPHTKRSTVLNRISLRPGDIVDTRQVRASERRLRASGLFFNDPLQGIEPRIVYGKPNFKQQGVYAQRDDPSDEVRGQSPDVPRPGSADAPSPPGDRWLLLGVEGRLAQQPPAPISTAAPLIQPAPPRPPAVDRPIGVPARLLAPTRKAP